MFEYFNNNPASFWFIIGFSLLALEILAFGFATGILLFGSIGALITGAVFWFGLVPQTWLVGIAVFAVSSAVSTLLLWKPLKSLQGNTSTLGSDRSSDLIGYEFRLEQTISYTAPGQIKYSGISWRVELDDSAAVESMGKGEKVKVNRVSAGIFGVVPA